MLIHILDVLHGILTRRDLKSSTSDEDKVKSIMTPREKLVTVTATEAEDRKLVLEKMFNNKIEKIPVLDE